MTTKELTYQYRLAQWSELVKEHVELGLSIRAYFYWRRRLQEAAHTQLKREQTSLLVSGFMEVALVSCTGGDGNIGPSRTSLREIQEYPPEHRRRTPTEKAGCVAVSPEPSMLVIKGERIYLACGQTDMCKSIIDLSSLVEGNFRHNPFDGALFVFCSRKRGREKFWSGIKAVLQVAVVVVIEV